MDFKAHGSLIVVGITLFLILFFAGLRPVQNTYGLREKFFSESIETYLRTEIFACLNTGEPSWRGHCMGELGDLLSSQFELKDTLIGLAAIDEEEGIKQQCHALVHYLGQQEYKKTGNLADTFRSCIASPVACGEGCFHGAVEGYLFENGGSLSAASVPTICHRDFAPNDVTYTACNHGLGHAFMLQFNADINESLKFCDYLSGSFERTQCYDGVFMENVFGFWNPDHPSEFIRPEDPHYPCTILDERYKNTCFAAQASFVIQQGMGDFRSGASFCAGVPQSFQISCYATLGGDSVVSAHASEEIRDTCALTPAGASRNACLLQALTFLGHQYAGHAEQLAGVCFMVADEDEQSCFTSVGKVLESWFPGEREEQCKLVNAKGTKEYEWCTATL